MVQIMNPNMVNYSLNVSWNEVVVFTIDPEMFTGYFWIASTVKGPQNGSWYG